MCCTSATEFCVLRFIKQVTGSFDELFFKGPLVNILGYLLNLRPSLIQQSMCEFFFKDVQKMCEFS